MSSGSPLIDSRNRSRRMKKCPILLLGITFHAFTIPIMHSGQTLSQFSTIDALMQGIYDGPATFARVRRYGDFGIGTVESPRWRNAGAGRRLLSGHQRREGACHSRLDENLLRHGLLFQENTVRLCRGSPPSPPSRSGSTGISDRGIFLVGPHPRHVPAREGAERLAPASALPPTGRSREVRARFRVSSCHGDAPRFPVPALHQRDRRPRLSLPLPERRPDHGRPCHGTSITEGRAAWGGIHHLPDVSAGRSELPEGRPLRAATRRLSARSSNRRSSGGTRSQVPQPPPEERRRERKTTPLLVDKLDHSHR